MVVEAATIVGGVEAVATEGVAVEVQLVISVDNLQSTARGHRKVSAVQYILQCYLQFVLHVHTRKLLSIYV